MWPSSLLHWTTEFFCLFLFFLIFFQYFHPNSHASVKLILLKHRCYHITLLLYSCLQSDISIHRWTFKPYTTITEISTEWLLFMWCWTLYRTPLEKPTAPSTFLASCNSACPWRLRSGDISPWTLAPVLLLFSLPHHMFLTFHLSLHFPHTDFLLWNCLLIS